MRDYKFLLKIGSIVAIMLFIGGYSLYESKNLLQGPILTISSPHNGTVVDTPLVEIKGDTKNISYISLNDRQISINEKGEFKEKLLLSSGYNIMKVKVTDKFGRQKEELLELVLKDTEHSNNLLTIR